MNIRAPFISALCLAALPVGALQAADGDTNTFQPTDVFGLEIAADPQVSPDGERIVYVRGSMDIMTDRMRREIWTIDPDGSNHRPLLGGDGGFGNPRFSPSGDRLLYLSGESGRSQIHVRWMDTGQTAAVTDVTESPGNPAWSPDGSAIAFIMSVDDPNDPIADMPAKPEGAEWAPRAKVVDEIIYRIDGQGFLEPGFSHLFVVPAEGGTPRRLTTGNFNHAGTPAWLDDGRTLLVSGNRHDDWETNPNNSEIYAVDMTDGSIRALTDREGPDTNPVVSPDGEMIAYLGLDDRYQGYQLTELYVMNADGSDRRLLTGDFDRSVSNPQWSPDGRAIFVQYGDEGQTKIARVGLDGKTEEVASGLGGLSLGRPYASGDYTVGPDGRLVYPRSKPTRPADLATSMPGREPVQLTQLNEDLLGHKELGKVEEIWYESSFDGRRIQGWVIKPPSFDPGKTYPLILEIHGGPFAHYGPHFAGELQLMASAGYVVLYTNPRGSTSYGEEFGNLIHHAYPSQDYDDLMSGVDAVIEQGYVDPERLYVTGGSGGGVLTSWIIGKTGRFAAAVVAKPVINWQSFVLTADFGNFFWRYWFPEFPWDAPEHYWARSPLSLVGNVTTPTMVLHGEADYRTPISEGEQYYTALKLRQVETVMVRIPGASHGIASRPSNLIEKTAHIIAWFDRHGARDLSD